VREEEVPTWKIVVGVVLTLVVGVALIFGFIAGAKAFSRYQKRQDANNNVKVTSINIRRAQQQARIVRAQIAATKAAAEKRFQESVGIRRAQDEIQATLTPLYLQHEAIQAQHRMAGSPNHTVIWAPSGANGVPLVSTVDLQRLAETEGK
jgi:hypothetical protein